MRFPAASARHSTRAILSHIRPLKINMPRWRHLEARAKGQFSITATDGEMRQLHAGDVVHLEDVAPCKGHITVVGDTVGFLLFAR